MVKLGYIRRHLYIFLSVNTPEISKVHHPIQTQIGSFNQQEKRQMFYLHGSDKDEKMNIL